MPAWYAHGYAVWSGTALGALGVWMVWRGARGWPGALWRRLRGVAYVPGELAKTHAWILAGALLGGLGGAAVGLEWELRDFQSFEAPTFAGHLQLGAAPGRLTAAWTDPTGRWSAEWKSACPRLLLQGEFLQWSSFARRFGFRDRHRVVAGQVSCSAGQGETGLGETQGAETARLRPPSRAWDLLRRWDRLLPVLRAEYRPSPVLRVESRSWRVFVVPGGYAFAE